MSSGNMCHRGTYFLTGKYVGPTVLPGIIAGEGILYERSPANIPRRQVAGETYPQRQVAGESRELSLGKRLNEEYDTQANLPFRQRVFSSHLDGQPITGIDVANAIAGPTFSDLYDDDAIGLCCLGILQLVLLGAESRRNVSEWNANVRHWGPLYVDQPRNEDDPTTYSIFGYTWAFKTWILESFLVNAVRYFDRFNWYPRVAAWSKKNGRFLAEMVILFL
nr:hypothetical protein [Tanacetum cinerariifolium]